MKALFHAGAAFGFCACVAGCAAPGASPVATTTANTVSAHSARDAVTIGRSTKADVMAALGKTTAIRFDSGYEVWVYRVTGESVTGETAAGATGKAPTGYAGSEQGMRGKTEFVLLFNPSGVVAKTRIRPAPAPGGAKGK